MEGFGGKKTPYGQIFTNDFQNDTCGHENTSFCANFVKFGRPEVGEIARYLMDKKTKFRLLLLKPLLRGSRPKFAADSSKQYTRSSPNPFTSGGVIAERVNIVQTRHKVFAILGEASASSPSKKQITTPSTRRKKCQRHVVEHSIAFRAVSIYWQGDDSFTLKSCLQVTCPLLSMVSYGRCQNSKLKNG